MAKWNVIGFLSVTLTLEAEKMSHEAEGKLIVLYDEAGFRLAAFTSGPGVAVYREDALDK